MKPHLKSKTVWLGTVVAVLSLVVSEDWIQEYPKVVSGIGFVIGALTLIVRQFTTGPVQNVVRRKG